ncbi:MAG: hypothetical protein ABI548_10715 [Polyangiaceae bacterium]
MCCLLALGVLFASACGGRSSSDASGDGLSGSAGTSTGRAGSSSAGASSLPGAGASSLPGAGASSLPGAGASSLPDAGAGGAPDVCNGVDCPDIVCPSNTAPVIWAGNCCPSCQSTCMPACTPCPVDTRAVSSGACCPSCVSDMPPPPSCDTGKTTYAVLRAQMLDKYAHGCVTDQDCVALAPSNRCEPGCGYAAVLATNLDNFNGNLSSQANLECVSCPTLPVPPCVPPQPPVCLNGACALPVE